MWVETFGLFKSFGIVQNISMEVWTILMLPTSILYIFIILCIVNIIKCEYLCKFVTRILQCRRFNQEDARNDIALSFHKRNGPENSLSADILLQNVVSESHKSHENTATWTGV